MKEPMASNHAAHHACLDRVLISYACTPSRVLPKITVPFPLRLHVPAGAGMFCHRESNFASAIEKPLIGALITATDAGGMDEAPLAVRGGATAREGIIVIISSNHSVKFGFFGHHSSSAILFNAAFRA